MKYELKKGQPPFEVVDGPYAGRKYIHGQSYTEVPPGDTKKFEIIKLTARPATAAPAKGGKK